MPVKPHPKLAKFKAAVEKRTSIQDVFLEPQKRMECVNSGSTVLNMLIGGSKTEDGSFVCPGYPRGRIVEIYGRESSGKSTLALSALAQAIDNGGKQNGCGLYVDLEAAVVDKYSKKIGVDFSGGSAERAMPHSFEETESLVTQAALNGIDIIIVDSVAGLVSNREVSRDTSDTDQKQGIAEVPRLMSNWMPKLQGIIARTGTCVIFLNQTRDKIGAKGYTEQALKSTTGGNALKFWASVRMLLQPKMSTKAKRFNPLTKSQEEVQISTDIAIQMIKNKVDAKQGHSGLITIRYGLGVDELRTMLNVAEAYKIAKVGKNAKRQEVWSFKAPSSGESVEGVGVERFRLEIGRRPDVMAEMLGLCQQKLIEGYDMLSDEELASLAEGAVSKKNDDDGDYEATDAPPVQFEEQDTPDDPNMPDPVEAAVGVDLSDV